MFEEFHEVAKEQEQLFEMSAKSLAHIKRMTMDL
jgi:hypothetical protein